jgi:SAM-dependent methyltransferase
MVPIPLLESKRKRTIMNVTCHTNDEQATLWNGLAGRAWVEAQKLLDQMFKPLESLLVEAVFAASGGRVLDVGCGTGGTTLAIARLLGAKGRCVGIDISDPMIAAARARAEQEGTSANFIRADARNYAFEPATFDMIISRFGVMFFDDPVRAFANLRLFLAALASRVGLPLVPACCWVEWLERKGLEASTAPLSRSTTSLLMASPCT